MRIYIYLCCKIEETFVGNKMMPEMLYEKEGLLDLILV